MAISPNTDFTSGQILTATQQNQFPRGIMALTSVTTSDNSISAEEVQITGSSFTAVANRYYKVTYMEPNIGSANTSGYATARIRLTNLAGAAKQSSLMQLPDVGITNAFFNLVWVGTLTAGTTNFVATLEASNGVAIAVRGSTQVAQLLVEDIGPA